MQGAGQLARPVLAVHARNTNLSGVPSYLKRIGLVLEGTARSQSAGASLTKRQGWRRYVGLSAIVDAQLCPTW